MKYCKNKLQFEQILQGQILFDQIVRTNTGRKTIVKTLDGCH